MTKSIKANPSGRRETILDVSQNAVASMPSGDGAMTSGLPTSPGFRITSPCSSIPLPQQAVVDKNKIFHPLITLFYLLFTRSYLFLIHRCKVSAWHHVPEP